MVKATKRLLAGSILAVVVLGAGPLWAQDTKVAERGLQVTGSYRLGEIETVNTKNGNVLLRVPLASLPPGRAGNPGFDLTLNYNSKLWDVSVEHTNNPDDLENLDPANPIQLRKLKPALGSPGWTYNYQYKVDLDRRSLHRFGLSSTCNPDSLDQNVLLQNQLFWYEYKVSMVFPDGSVHVFLPEGEARNGVNNDEYFPVQPDGRRLLPPCGRSLAGPAPGTQTISYYSVDGTYLRLEFEVARDDDEDGTLDPETLWPSNNWTLYFPNGRRVSGTGLMSDEMTGRTWEQLQDNDPNENTTTITIIRVLAPGDTPQDVITDSEGRQIIVRKDKARGKDYISQTGAGGAQLQWTVNWGKTTVSRDYWTGGQDEALCVALDMVNGITLPAQLGSLTYSFAYNGIANPMDSCQDLADSTGLGEISQVTVPWGARATYSYIRDIDPDDEDTSGRLSQADLALNNQITRKDFVYNVTGQINAVTETWTYNNGTVTAPDGGQTRETYSNEGWLEKVERLDGTRVVSKVERKWATNPPRGLDTISARRANPYVKTEFTTVSGSPSKMAIKDFTYDKNGNVLRVDEYDWVTRNSASRPTGVPAGASAKRVTAHTYHVETQEAINTTTANNDAYHRATSPNLKRARKSTEIRDGSGTRLSRREFTYDNDNADARTTGNLKEEKIWDSTRGGVSDPLTPSNSITISHTYDKHGNRLTTNDGEGNVTEWSYGEITGSGSPSRRGLYPTVMVVAAGNALLQRTTHYSYDFHTGAVTSAIDADNGVTTRTTVDAVGRPVMVEEADGVSGVERQTRTWYCDSQRRMIVRSDLAGNAGDGELVTVTDYDQAGRERLSRSWERNAPPMPRGTPSNAHCTAYPSDSDSDSDVIKVKTHYQYVNSGSASGFYTTTSNPYKATATTGWSRTRQDRLGRVVEVAAFGGATRPSARATPSWGKTTTAYDAEYTTVTDADQKKRRSQLDGLGRLLRVDEPDSNGNLGLPGSPTQKTDYCYDALGNLTRVIQGSQRIQGGQVDLCTGVIQGAQTRTFAYDSLSRLTSATNPESGTTSYSYDKNGNLTGKTDARGVATTYSYDRLDRLTGRSYSYTGADSGVSLETTQVAYAYDNCGAYARGRLCSVTASKGETEVSKTAYNRYDALGRVLGSTQTTGETPYRMVYAYDRAGNLVSQTYPSGKVIKTVYDGAGRVAGVKTGVDGWYAGGEGDNAVEYEAYGGLRQLRLGNGLWEQRRYNARLQPTQIGLGTTTTTGGTLVATGTTPSAGLLLLDYSYGTISNNGNVLSQQIRVGDSLDLTQAYTYDELNRLKTARETGSGTTWSQTYQYDRYGNRAVTANSQGTASYLPLVDQTLTPQALTSFNTSSNRLKGLVAYDGAGNLTQDWGMRNFKYDGENRMVDFNVTAGGTLTHVKYRYDGEGRRIEKEVVGGATTTYVYNVLGQLLAEFGGTAPEARGTRYLTPDSLGSTRVVTGDGIDGTAPVVLSRHDYLPFGQEIEPSRGNRNAVSGYTADLADGPTQKFTGKERDSESRLDYFGARYFGGAGGRFTSVDPENAGADPIDPQSWNGYSYVLNMPLNLIDPTGEEWVSADGGTTYKWVNSCSSESTGCFTTVAVVTENGLRVYGRENDKDVHDFNANAPGVVDLTAITGDLGKDAGFVYKEGDKYNEHYAALETAAGLYNLARDYHAKFLGSDLLRVSGVATKKGGSAFNKAGKRIHRSHDGAMSVDLSYQDNTGKNLPRNTEGTAASKAHLPRLQFLINRSQYAYIGHNVSSKLRVKVRASRINRHNDHFHLRRPK